MSSIINEETTHMHGFHLHRGNKAVPDSSGWVQDPVECHELHVASEALIQPQAKD